MLDAKRLVGIGLCVFGFALSAKAGPGMFEASFIWHAWGNDITTGTVFPYNTYLLYAAPRGHDCQSASPYTPNGATAPRYCSRAIIEAGYPITGSGTLVSGGATVGGVIALPAAAIVADVTGFLRSYYPYLQSHTYADFENEAGTFFAGGGPAAATGMATHTGMGQVSGQWYITAGKNGFGGVLGLLGAYGAKAKYAVVGKAGTYEGTGTWAMVDPIGRPQYATPIGYTPMGKTTAWRNPFEKTNVYVNNLNGNTSLVNARGTGTLWTTGMVTLYARAGVQETMHFRTGFDTVTAGGVRNIQLVTPTLTHWIGPGYQGHTGQMGILNLRITPEPEAVLLLATSCGLLALLYWTRNRRA